MTVDLETFRSALARHPAVVTHNGIAAGLVLGVKVHTPRAFLSAWDSGDFDPTGLHAIISPRGELSDRFPVMNPGWDPFDHPGLSEALFSQSEVFGQLMPTQDRIGQELLSHAGKDVIVLVLVDGLSFRDCRDYDGVRPCLAPGVSLTSQGFRRVAGHGRIAQALFEKGFTERLGFTYWSRDNNPLTDDIFTFFDPSRLFCTRQFDDVLSALEKAPLRKTYVQVVVQGLDAASHKGGDEPLVGPIVERLFRRVEALGQIIGSRGLRASVFLVSDHGILWRDGNNLTKIREPAWTVADGVRYLRSRIDRPYLALAAEDGRYFSLAKRPFIFRSLGRTEWGVHGGVSYEESIVPFYCLEVNR